MAPDTLMKPRFVWLTPLDPQGEVLPQEAIAVTYIVAVTPGKAQPHPATFAEQTFTPGATVVLGRGWHIHVQETALEVLALCLDEIAA